MMAKLVVVVVVVVFFFERRADAATSRRTFFGLNFERSEEASLFGDADEHIIRNAN